MTTRSAVISEDERYRYRLDRRWSEAQGTTLFVMLNPSTANGVQDDPTIRRCLGFAKRWGHGRLIVVNLFAYRATDPRELADVDDPVGASNDYYLREARSETDLVIAAWGVPPSKLYADHYMRALEVLKLLAGPPTVSCPKGAPIFCLGVTRKGHPRHPLYLPKDSGLRKFRW